MHIGPRRFGAGGKKTILLVDDHPVLRRGLAALIASDPELAVCGEAATCQAALDSIREHQPDMVIVDLMLDGSDGLDLIKAMRAQYPSIPALVLSLHAESVYAERALRAGARGYVTKHEVDERILSAVRRVLAGETYMSGALERWFATRFVSGATLNDSPLGALSDRELQVYHSIGTGRGTRQIAETLHLSVKTIESHCDHIKQKLGLVSARELAQCAARWVATGSEAGDREPRASPVELPSGIPRLEKQGAAPMREATSAANVPGVTGKRRRPSRPQR